MWDKEKYFPIYINSLNIFKLWDEWREVSLFFKKPKVTWSFYKEIYSCNKYNLFSLRIDPLRYKYKWGEPRHEDDPKLTISFFHKWTIQMRLGMDESYLYWEAILWQIQNENLYSTYMNNIWRDSNGKELNIMPYLTEFGKGEIEFKEGIMNVLQ
jgi:hypothetical protein